MFWDFCTSSQPFFYFYSLKRGTKWRKFWVQHIQFKWFLLKLESIIMFLTRGLFFTFVMVIFTRLLRRGSTLCKSTLKMTTCFEVVQHCKFQLWRIQCCFDVVWHRDVISTYEQRENVCQKRRCSGLFIVNLQHISRLFLVSLMFFLSK